MREMSVKCVSLGVGEKGSGSLGAVSVLQMFTAEAQPHALITVIAHFLMFVYEVSTCRHELNRIYCR